jgi:hypothetical protein
MDAGDATQLYGEAILNAMDRIRAAGIIHPQHQAELCLAIHASVEEAFCRPELRDHTTGFLCRLSERIHAALAEGEAEAHLAGPVVTSWLSPGDE